MTRAGVWLVRAALVHLVLGTGIGALALAAKATAVFGFAYRLLPLHVECVLVGWTVQLAFGVAHWILPRRPGGPPPWDAARVWAAWVLVNTGVGLAGAGGLAGGPAWALPVGRGAESLAMVLFAAHAWPRIRAYTPRAPGAIA